MADTIRASDPKTVAHALREHLRHGNRTVHLKPFDHFRSSETIYWLIRSGIGPAHYLAKGVAMPYGETAGEATDVLVGFYLEKGFEAPNADADRHPHLLMDGQWDWHTATEDPAALDAALHDARDRGGPVRVVLRTRSGTLHFDFDDRLAYRARTVAPVELESDGIFDDGIAYCSRATSIEALFTILRNVPGVEGHYMDLYAGHTFHIGTDTHLTSAELARQSILPWAQWIWPK